MRKVNGSTKLSSVIKEASETNGTSSRKNTSTINHSLDVTAASTSTTETSNTTQTAMTNRSTASTMSRSNLHPLEPIGKIERSTRAGVVLAVGENLSNQLGLGTEVDSRKKPQLVRDLPVENVLQVVAGGMHSAALTADGDVYTFGCNDEFALGRDDNEDIDKVELPEKCIEITAGDSHTAALSESGCVYAWGTFRDGSGVLGLNQSSSRASMNGNGNVEKVEKIAKRPVKIDFRGERIVKIASGSDHLVALTHLGEVYTAGNSQHGQLGRISKYNADRGGRRGPDMLLEPGLVRFGLKRELKGHRQIEDVFTTTYCTFLKVKDSDIVLGFGLNNRYQLGIASDLEPRYQPEILTALKFSDGARLKKVCGGMHHTLVLDTLGRVYAFGSHDYGCLGLGKSLSADLTQPQQITTLPANIADIAANTNVSYALAGDGKVYAWGTNYSKQLGLDTEDDYFEPTRVQSRHMDVRDVYAVSVGGQHALFIVSEEEKSSDMED